MVGPSLATWLCLQQWQRRLARYDLAMHRWGTLAVSLVLGSVWACGSVPTTPTRGRGSWGETARDSARVVAIARSLLSTPYLYAGSDPAGFDCSGLTSYLFSQVGLRLPRTAQSQASAGRWIAPDELSGGDLVFFGDHRTKPYHVGLVVSSPGEPLTMIHSSTSRGVIETAVLTNSYWLSRLRFGRRVLAD